MNLINKLIASFDNSKDGFSARKLTAFSLMTCIGYIHYKFIDKENAIEAIIIDLCGTFLLLGLITVDQIIQLKNGKPQA